MSDAPIVSTDGHEVLYRASALGGCLRRLWAARNEMDARPVPKAMQVKFEEGHMYEQPILDALSARGWTIFGQQSEIKFEVGKSYNGKTIYVVGHVDALGHPPDTIPLPIDVKAFGHASYVASFS